MASFATEGDKVANLFMQPNFWKPSKLLASPAPLAKDFFDLIVKDGPLGNNSPVIRDEGYFKPPQGLDDALDLSHPSAELPGNVDDVSMRSPIPGSEEDPWLSQNRILAKSPEFKTWDSFDIQKAGLEPSMFITEAGTAAYDAFLSSQPNPCDIKSNNSYQRLDPTGYSACLLALSLGRESVLFSWNQEKKTFLPTLRLAKVPGYSGESLVGMLRLCVSCGEACRRLRSFIERTYSTDASPSRVALANALDRLLLVVQDELGVRGLRTRSILQLQSLIRPVFALLSYFYRLVSKIQRSTTDSNLLSLIYNEAQSVELGEPFLKDTMGEILRMVSKPWTDFVEEWVGLKQEDGVPVSKDGPGKGFVRVDGNFWIDDQGFELEEPDYFLDMDNMPTFVPDDIAQAIFETGRNLRFLRTNHPQHPLSSPRTVTSAQAPELVWQYDWESIKRVEQKALAYQQAVSETLRKSRLSSHNHEEDSSDDFRVEESPILQFFGKDEARLEETVLASMAHLDHPVDQAAPWDNLSKILRERIFKAHDSEDTAGTDFNPHWSLLPLLSFGPLIYAQARLVNRECLRLLYSEHNLRAHLRLQRDFQMLGNGMFSSRLANALFNPDLDTTERANGVVRSGGTMGLRLASRDTWPPASSELRLALMGVLKETASRSAENSELPGDLSFAIRDLSAEEMEKCMDPDSLEALDFLRMSYKAPPPLVPIMTPAILVKYDRIFKLLLRVIRMLFVVDQLYRDTSSSGSSRWTQPGPASFRFRIEAHHFVSNVARYFFDTGIDRPWRRFEAWLDRVERGLASDDAVADRTSAALAVSPDRLGEQHERTLDDVMAALLLKKRQKPVLALLEDIFTLILRFARKARLRAEGAQGSEQEMGELYRGFRAKVEVFITVCRGMSEKTGYGQKRDGGGGVGKAEENSIVMLLLLLDMSNYYAKR